MNKKLVVSAAAIGMVFAFQAGVSASELNNESIGLRMEIDDQNEIEITTQDLVKEMEYSLSISSFDKGEDNLAVLLAMTDETDQDQFYDYLLDGIGDAGYHVYGDKVNQNGCTYYLVCKDAEPDTEDGAWVESIQKAFDQAEFYTPVEPTINTSDFKAVTLDGKEVGNEIFQDKDITMIHIWSTNCNPCLEELPSLSAWEKELPENVQILYLDKEVGGVAAADKKIMDKIIKKTGINPEQVLQFEPGFSEALDMLGNLTPTTFFVDSEGNRVGEIVLGANMEGYQEMIQQLLEEKQ